MGRAGFDVPALIRKHLPTGLVAHIHLNDPNRRGPGEGEMKFGPILAALFEMKYAGMASIEPFIYEPDGPTCAARQIGYVRGVHRSGENVIRIPRANVTVRIRRLDVARKVRVST